MNLAQHPYAYPLLEIVHLLGVSLLLGNLALIESRAFGWGRDLPLAALARASLALALAGFALAAMSGLVMFATQAAELLANRAFVLKMGLMAAAAVNAAVFHARGALLRQDAWAKMQLAASALLWVAVLACGRWIAYA